MSQCPYCQTEIPDDFGLINCEGCGKALFVNMDGSVDTSEDAVDEPSYATEFHQAQEELEAPVESESTEEDNLQKSIFDNPVPTESFGVVEHENTEMDDRTEVQALDQDQIGTESQASLEDYNLADQGQEPLYQEEEATEVQEFSEQEATEVEFDSSNQLPEAGLEEISEQQLDEGSLEEEFASTEGAEEFQELEQDFEAPATVAKASAKETGIDEIAEYGNSELASAEQGSVYYNIKIEGLDSEQLRNEFIESIQDAKFFWDTNKILKDISEGSVLIRDVSALKASVLLNSVQNLPIKITWNQYLIQGPAVDESGTTEGEY